MARVERTVFISYRRSTVPWVLAIYQNLTHRGYDVFFDYQGIGSGDFERIILENIRARAHFLVLLTPSALKRCADQGDWLRREIETALDSQRNIVPLMLDGFDFNTPSIARHLTGMLAHLKRYNALSIPADYFAEAMDRLRERHLSVPLDAVLHPASHAATRAVQDQHGAADAAPVVRHQELTTEEWFERGVSESDPDEKLRCYNAVIRLNPNHGSAHFNRGNVRHDRGDLDGALMDFDAAIRLDPGGVDVYVNRGLARHDKGDLDGALTDFNAAIRLDSRCVHAYYNRGIVRDGGCPGPC
jgi:hypothetical protein